MEKHEPKDQESGFTLVELMVVIFILGLLTTIVVINVLPSQDKAMNGKAKADIATLEQAVEMYRLDMFKYPDAGEGLVALTAAPASLSDDKQYRQGGYIRRLPKDPWGNAYQYAAPGRTAAFDIFSLGADGLPGGADNAADIYGGE